MKLNKWQSIETAPKDIDVLVVNGGYVFIARCVPAKTLLASNGYDGWSEYDETEDEYYCPAGWYQHTDCECCEHNYSFLSESPTHWTPLPKPPSN